MAEQLKKRHEVRIEDTWNLEAIFENDQAWERELALIEKEIPKLAEFKGKLGESPELLLSCLQKQDEVFSRAQRLYVYANMKSHEDLGNNHYQGMAAKAQTMLTTLFEAASYFEPEILEIPEQLLEQFLKQQEGLQLYKRKLEQILLEKEHTLNTQMEEMLAKMNDVCQGPEDIFTLFDNVDLQFPVIKGEDGQDIQITHGRYISLLESRDRQVRHDAFMGLYNTYEKYKNTLAATYSASVKKDVFLANVRKYQSARHRALFQSRIPVEVYDNLIDSVHKHLGSMYRYVALRRRALKVEELHMYDLYVPIVSGIDYKVDFQTAKEMVKDGLAFMGQEYLDILQEGFDNRWIDVYENQGKKSGAYSWGAYGTMPYVLLNYDGSLNNVFTLAHEMGHSLHSYYSSKNQPFVYSDYHIFVAEVASTCNESLLIHHLMKRAKDKKEKAYLINYFLEQFRGTLFRQTMFGEFEKLTHEMTERGEALNSENMCDIYYSLNQQYFGQDMVIDREIAMEWARIPHFYNAFYVYQYATGFSAAIALSKRIMEEGKSAVEDYMKFLKGGSSMDPLKLLQTAGVDMSKKEPVEAALHIFDQLVEELEQLLDD